MTLFDSPSQYRENATIRRVFLLLPLYNALAAGSIWRWFAVNIPMDLRTGGQFTGDLDIVAKLRNHRSKESFYRTWEVKVSLLRRDGAVGSLKTGKFGKMLNQLRAHRKFGSPYVSLIEMYVCEPGFLLTKGFPPSLVTTESTRRAAELRRAGYGYQWLPFEHDEDLDQVTTAPRRGAMRATTDLLRARQTPIGSGFRRLADRLDERFEAGRGNALKHLIMFCRKCKQIQIVAMKDGDACPTCGDYLLQQS
jgi:hypothetical protein